MIGNICDIPNGCCRIISESKKLSWNNVEETYIWHSRLLIHVMRTLLFLEIAIGQIKSRCL